jgi:hypothetical protein
VTPRYHFFSFLPKKEEKGKKMKISKTKKYENSLKLAENR